MRRKTRKAPSDQITRQRAFHMPVQNGGEAGGENRLHFLTREGGDGFMHPSARDFLRQGRAQRQGGSKQQDQKSK